MFIEGGHAVENVIAIHQANTKDTIQDISDRILTSLGVSIPQTARVLGSAGKKGPDGKSGDIDLAINIDLIMKKNNLKDENQLFSFIEAKAKKFSPSVIVNKGTRIISVAWPIVNSDGKQPDAYVQMDLMLVPERVLDYSEFAFWSPKESESKYKGVYRTSLLITIAKIINMKIIEREKNKEGEEVPATWERLFMDLRTGLHKGKQTIRSEKTGALGKTKRTFDKALVSTNKDEVIEMLLGKDATEKDVNSFESIWNFIHSNKFPYKDKVKEIEMTYAQDLEDQKMPIPKEVGKMLHEESSLIKKNPSGGLAHLTHLEDLVFEHGKEGAKLATDIISRFLHKFEKGAEESSDLTVSEKIDGAPSLYFGTAPDGRFFVGTKAVLSQKEQKIIYSLSDIRKYYQGGVGDVLALAFNALKGAFREKGYACQGDMLWSSNAGKSESTIQGKAMLTFQPNTIMYGIPVDPKSDLYKKAKKAVLGIVIHGAYETRFAEGERVEFERMGIDKVRDFADELNRYPSVFVIHPYIDNLDIISGEEAIIKEANDTLASITEAQNQIDPQFNKEWKSGDNDYLRMAKNAFPTFIQHQIRSASGEDVIFTAKDEKEFLKRFHTKFKEYMNVKLKGELEGLKSLKGKEQKTQNYKELLDYMSKSRNTFDPLLLCFFRIHNVKMLIVEMLDKLEKKLGQTFVVDRKGDFEIKAVKPEGYVFLAGDNMVKIVDRMEFTKNNMLFGRFVTEEVEEKKPTLIIERTVVDEVVEDVLSAMESLKNDTGFEDQQIVEAANKMKDYSVVYVGRFQPPTIAHANNIVNLSRLFKDVYVFVSKAENTTPKYLQRNPLTDEERIKLLESDPKIRNLMNIHVVAGPTQIIFGLGSANPETIAMNSEEMKKLLKVDNNEILVIALGKEDDRYFLLQKTGFFFDVNRGEKPSDKKKYGLYGIALQKGEDSDEKISASVIRDAVMAGDFDKALAIIAGSDALKQGALESIRDKLKMVNKTLKSKKKLKESIRQLSEQIEEEEKLAMDEALDIVIDTLEE